MRSRRLLLATLLTPMVLIGLYAAFLWTTYISDETSQGAAHGFTISSSKSGAVEALAELRRIYPEAVVAAQPITGVGAPVEVGASAESEALAESNLWNIQLDGSGRYNNLIRLTFERGELVSIYRHRQHFELP